MANHKYNATSLLTGESVKGEIMSVTTFIGSLFQSFEGKEVVKKMKSKSKKYGDMTDDEIVKYWKQNGDHSADLGTRMHSVMEELLNLNTNLNTKLIRVYPSIPTSILSKYDDIVPEQLHDRDGIVILETHINQFFEHMEKNNLIPIATEKFVFNAGILIAGTFDALFRNSTGQYFLYDWKRRPEFTKKIHMNMEFQAHQLNIYNIVIIHLH